MKRIIFLILLSLFLVNCSTISEADIVYNNIKTLNGFKNVTIITSWNNTSDELKGPYIELKNIFENIGFHVIEKDNIKQLNYEDRIASLICVASVSKGYDEGPLYPDIYLFDIKIDNVLQQTILKIKCKTSFKDLPNTYKKIEELISKLYDGYNSDSLIVVEDYFPNIKYIDMEKKDLIEYYDNNELDKIEGIWTEADNLEHVIGIFEDTSSNSMDFSGIIISSDNIYWEPKQVKLELNGTSYDNIFLGYYYDTKHEIFSTEGYIDNLGYLNFNLKDAFGEGEAIKYIKNYPKHFSKNSKATNNGENETTTKSSSGSGTLISHDGLIATNYHVVDGAKEIKVNFSKLGRTYLAKEVVKDISNDIALIKIDNFYYEDIFSTPIPFSVEYSTSVNLGDYVYTLGFPLGDILGEAAKFSNGTINALMGIGDDPRTFIISNPIQPGSSGGPLFDKNGNYIGLVVSSLNAGLFFNIAGIIPQNVNFAIKSDYLINLINVLPQREEILERKNILLGHTVQEQINLLEPYITNIMVNK